MAGTRAFGFQRHNVLTIIMPRCDCESAHSYQRESSLAEWTLPRPKRRLCSSKYSPCSSRHQFGNALVHFRCTPKLNRLVSIARRRGWVTFHACRYILICNPFRSLPIQPHPLSHSPFYPPMPPFRMIVSSFASRNTVPFSPLTRILSSSLPRTARLLSAGNKQKKWINFWIRLKYCCGMLSNLMTSPRLSFYIVFVPLLGSWTT